MKELMDKLRSTHGEFAEWEDHIEWYAEIDSWNPEFEESHDRLCDIYCETANEIRPLLGDEYEIVDSWQDNDSTGFDIRRKSG
jgi:hypothetical protein